MSRHLSMTPRAIENREAIARARIESRCLDCQTETPFTPRGKNEECYMVHDHIWLKANSAGAGKLCIEYLENRIGRRLMPTDFIDCPLNNYPRGSARLISRLTGRREATQVLTGRLSPSETLFSLKSEPPVEPR